jgi:hypothetical protein
MKGRKIDELRAKGATEYADAQCVYHGAVTAMDGMHPHFAQVWLFADWHGPEVGSICLDRGTAKRMRKALKRFLKATEGQK